MATADTRHVTCKGCGAERSPELASTFHRPPCPECGETAICLHQTITAEGIGTVDSAIPNAPLRVYPETGHLAHWVRPEWVVRDLGVFMIDTRPAYSVLHKH